MPACIRTATTTSSPVKAATHRAFYTDSQSCYSNPLFVRILTLELKVGPLFFGQSDKVKIHSCEIWTLKVGNFIFEAESMLAFGTEMTSFLRLRKYLNIRYKKKPLARKINSSPEAFLSLAIKNL